MSTARFAARYVRYAAASLFSAGFGHFLGSVIPN
jgi:hypothetical protein